MKIRSIELQHFRKFINPVRIAGFGDGINVLVGPNEYGKSTILAALQALLFERYRSRTDAIRRMQTAGSETSPILAIDFDLPSGHHRLEKRFLHREPYARLFLPNGRQVHDDAAEEQLQELLGFLPPNRQGASPDTQGIWGLLWVEQGASFDKPQLRESTRRTLRECLDAEVGTLAGGQRGQRLLAAIDRELGALVDGRGRPTGTWKAFIEETAHITTRLTETQQRRHDLEDHLKALDNLRASIEQAATDGNDERLQTEQRTTQQALDTARHFEDQLGQARATHEVLRVRREAAANEIVTREQLENTIRQAGATTVTSRAEHDAAKTDLETRRSHQTHLAAQEASLYDDLKKATAALERLETTRQMLVIQDSLTGLERSLNAARTAAERAEELNGRATAITVDDKTLQKLRNTETAHTTAQAAFDAATTRLEFSLKNAALGRVSVDGKPIKQAQYELQVDQPTTIGLDELGEIRIRPGARDTNDLREVLRKAERNLQELLTAAGAATVADADLLSREKARLLTEADAARREITAHTPARTLPNGLQIGAGTDALSQAVAALRSQIATHGSLATGDHQSLNREITEVNEKVKLLEAQRDKASAAARKADRALEDAIHREATTRAAVTRATEDEETPRRDLVRRRAEKPDDALRADLGRLELDRAAAEAALTRLGEDAQTREPLPRLEARLQRLTEACEERQRAKENREGKRREVEGAVSALRGAGIDEEIAGLEQELTARKEDQERQERRVAALKLLSEELRRAEREAKERYLAPITQRIEPYLQALLPGARIHCDDELALQSIERTGVPEDFDRLSGGTQEQIAVLTRLAFADLLLDRGRPAAIILDDSLAFADPRRLERMFDILTEASRRMQVTILSCREWAFERLGGKRLVLEEGVSPTERA
jgi:chromosome segregation ATPase